MKKIRFHWFKSYKVKKLSIYYDAFSSLPPSTHKLPNLWVVKKINAKKKILGFSGGGLYPIFVPLSGFKLMKYQMIAQLFCILK